MITCHIRKQTVKKTDKVKIKQTKKQLGEFMNPIVDALELVAEMSSSST